MRVGKHKKRLRVAMHEVSVLEARPVCVEGLNQLLGVDDDDEEEILQANPTLVPLFEVQEEKIKDKYVHSQTQGLMIPEDEGEVELPAEAQARWEEFQLRESKQPQRVPEDAIVDINIKTTKEPRFVKISKTLDEQTTSQITDLLKEYSDVFAWSYKDMKDIDPAFYEHHIDLWKDAMPIRQQRYSMNPNYAAEVKEEIDKLLAVGFIYPIDKITWLSPIVIVPNKNGTIRVCVDYRKLNAATTTYPFPIPFTDAVLDAVAGHEIYSFLDGFSGYNQVLMAPEDRDKTTFVT